MKEPINKGTDEEFIPRVKWSEIEYYIPFKFRITDWKNLKIAHYGRGDYLLALSEMDYNKKKIELCVPYSDFIRRVRDLPLEEQRWIIQGNAMITIVKTFRMDFWGMKITKVELINNC